VPRPWEPPQTNYCSLHLYISKNQGIGFDFFSLKVKNSISRVHQRSKTIAVEGTIFVFGFSKKYDISLLSIKCRVLDRCRAFNPTCLCRCPPLLSWPSRGKNKQRRDGAQTATECRKSFRW
jgi:hypothetical protein